ncbi:glutathione S-transferase family protein [Exilibacterium tricleocarpae]|uniref:Glutathione S-transferase family protein n=1 Tax=Exilibacterium tricleocarpae TaxID=2591008 RepID=A0A545T2B2_9GAMM|nr:glutathione S-transferase family protein [Exilibacterium tricleocarpae]TQV71354.1 glutathione S-transferase family protein [Exilibacterium tricleocarpae]
MYRVYGDILSGNCYKIKLLLELLQLPHEWVHVSVLAGETRTPDFIKMNRNAKIPVLEIAGPDYLCESNAILNYLAEGTDYLPAQGLARARVLQWQFFEQYSHEPYIAVARFINRFLGLPPERAEEYAAKQEGGHKALAVMEQQLGEAPYLVGATPTIADISLYAYTHVAPDGGFSLDAYPQIRAWLQRIEALPHYVGIE